MVAGMSDLDIAFLAGLFPREFEGQIHENSVGSVQSAANALQWLLAEGLDGNQSRPVTIINSPYVGAYPRRYRRVRIPTFTFEHAPGATDVNVGFINVPLLKHFLRYWTVRPHLRTWARRPAPRKVLMAYALTGTFMWCIKYAKALDPQIQTVMVVPDLPQYMNTTSRRGMLYSALKHLEIMAIRRHMGHVDKWVLLTDAMAEALGVRRDYLVVEGIASPEARARSVGVQPTSTANKTLLYSGGLNEQYGVVRLVDAFMRIDDPDYRLLLCGSGDSEGTIAKAAERDSRIVLMGRLPRGEVLGLQAAATALVNPRQNDSEYTRYSFPSKLMEYLASGRPVVAYKLDGVPSEYDPHLWYVEDDSIEALRDKLVQVCETDPQALASGGEAARDFVTREKSALVQGKRILGFLRDGTHA